MAQTLPPSSDPSAPLPRYERKRAGGAKALRPRFQGADAALALLFCAVFLAVSLSTHAGLRNIGPATCLLALTAGATFLLGWRCGGRICGIIAGSLVAFSLGLTGAVLSWETALLTLLTIGALFAFACDAAAAACALAGIAAVVRPDSLLLGFVLLAVVLTRARRQLPVSLGAFFGTIFAGWLVRIFVLHTPFGMPQVFPDGTAMSWLLAPAQTIVVWMLIPLCAELTDPARRLRWLPTAVWGLLALLLAIFVHFGPVQEAALPLMPVVFVLAAGGLTRLMPSLAGDNPAGRYALATVAIVALLLLRAHTEWKQRPAPPRVSASAAQPVSPVNAVPVAVSAPLPPPNLLPQAQVPRPVKPKKPAAPRFKPAMQLAVKKPAPKPAIALYTMRNGHLVRRTKWAILWEKTHPQAAQ